MNTFEILKKGMLMSKDTKEKEIEKTKKQDSKNNEEKITELETKTEKKNDNSEQKNNKETSERKISFNLNKSILPDINIENPINSLFKLIPTFSIPQTQNNETNKEDGDNEPEIIVLDDTNESLMIYQQKMIDLREENNFLKNQIKEYVSKVAWLEEHFTIRQENANVQHLQELEHIRKANERETKEYNDKIKELEDAVEVLQVELARQTDLLAEEKDTLTFTTSANWNLEKKISELEDKLKIKNSESIDLKTQIINVKEQLESKTEENDKLKEKYNTLLNESENFSSEIEKLKKENALLSEKFKIYDNISKRSTKSLESKYHNLYSPTTPKTKSNSEYSFSLYPTTNDTNSTTTNSNKPEPINTKIASLTQTETSVMSGRSSFIEDTELNDLMDEISFNNETINKKTERKNLFEHSEPSQEITEENDDEHTYNSVTQPQNILTEINLN